MRLINSEWTGELCDELLDSLINESEKKYGEFQSALIPGVDSAEIIGIRLPRLREIAKEISKGNPKSFLLVCSSDVYDMVMLRGIVTGLVKPESFADFIELCDSFIPQIDNWAVCDSFCSGLKQVKKYKAEFFEHIKAWLNSETKWAVRAALVVMLDYYLDDEYIDRVLKRTDKVKSEEYYVSMARAWLIATALAKCHDKTLVYYHSNSLDTATYNRAVQKAIESRRIDDETKNTLRYLKKIRTTG